MAIISTDHDVLFPYLDNDGEIDEHVFFAEKIQPHEELLVVLLVAMCDHLKRRKISRKISSTQIIFHKCRIRLCKNV